MKDQKVGRRAPLSEAEVLEKARVKVKTGDYCFGPQVAVQIEALRKVKKRSAAQNPDCDYHTTIDLDLLNVISTGVATEVAPLTEEPYWSIAIKGIDYDGFPLVVHVNLHYEDAEPLYIWGFVHCDRGED